MREANPVIRAKQRPTYLNAIKAMCAHCMGCTVDHTEPGFRDSISNCTAPSCPLYSYRPYQAKKTPQPYGMGGTE